MSKKRIVILSIIAGLLVICLYISLSYSYYQIGNNKVEIETAMETPDCVGVTIDSGEAFSLKGDYAVPITNAQFLNSKEETQDIYKYSFTITSTCENQDLSGLQIGLVPLEGSNLDITNLKYILVKSEENTNSFIEEHINDFKRDDVKKLTVGMEQQLKTSYGASASHVYPVGEASFGENKSTSYDLYVWIGSHAGNETMNQNFNAAIVLFKDQTILNVLLNSDPGNGELIHHTEDVPNSAGDGGYRYSGDDPNNFICFGKGSEEYNNGETDKCPLDNKYRIIGYVPVTLANGNEVNRIKVIKAEYFDGTQVSINDAYSDIKRIESESKKFEGSSWGNSGYLNSGPYSFFNRDYGFINETIGIYWKDKIEMAMWNTGEIGNSDMTPEKFYNAEMNEKGTSSNVETLIGLMYSHDYGFASSQKNWDKSLKSYNDDNNINNNWLFNGVEEWTITTGGTYSTFTVGSSGSISSGYIGGAVEAYRPVFYLKSNIYFVNDKTANGSKDRPFRIDMQANKTTLLEMCDVTGNLTECFKNIGDATIDVGDGELIHHTSGIKNSAEDGGYRYSGNQPNNYICLGNGSEKYNKGEVATCPLENKYRIIGYVPVTINGEEEFRVKVIKAEYLTKDEFPSGNAVGTASYSDSYAKIKRIESAQTGIPSYKWNDNGANTWAESSLYKSLNSSDYINKAFGDTWLNKIEKVKWNVGGVNNFGNVTAQKMYQAETTEGSGTTVPAQIGLMYVHDYGFASSSINWNTNLNSYAKNDNRNNNWMFNGVYEWTISHNSSITNYAYFVYDAGHASNYEVILTYVAVRPVFYLKSDIEIVKDKTTNGSKDKPFKIQIGPSVNNNPQLKMLLQTPVGDQGTLLQHTLELENSAGDYGYRYSGNQPNNYICFGVGSENYNQKNSNETCNINNKYRIIGYVPVSINDKREFRLKVIKAEYLTNDDIPTTRTSAKNDEYTVLRRIETSGDIAGYHRYGLSEDKDVFALLNLNDYIDKTFGETWQNKIEKVTWYGRIPNADISLSSKDMYDYQMRSKEGTYYKLYGQIGLMQVHDYGFASSSNNWQFPLNKYDNSDGNNNREYNWLFNAVREWTMSNYSHSSSSTIRVKNDGGIGLYDGSDVAAVRPVFYLKPDVVLDNSNGANGTMSSPLRVLA